MVTISVVYSPFSVLSLPLSDPPTPDSSSLVAVEQHVYASAGEAAKFTEAVPSVRSAAAKIWSL